VQAPPPEATGPAVQTPPVDLPRPAVRPATPILPPLMAPQQPSWKHEARPEPPAGETKPETKPAETGTPEDPAKSNE
jgi:hypothetical protein